MVPVVPTVKGRDVAFWAKVGRACGSARRHAWVPIKPDAYRTVCRTTGDAEPPRERYRFPKRWGTLCRRCDRIVVDEQESVPHDAPTTISIPAATSSPPPMTADGEAATA